MRELLEHSLRHALAKLEPADLVRPHLPGSAPTLIVAVGKAAMPMLAAATARFPEARWLAVPPEAQLAELEPQRLAQLRANEHAGKGRIVPGSHPLPTEKSVAAGEAVLKAVQELREGHSVLLLLSGGGSSLLCAPHGVTLTEKRAVADELMRRGADIFELNCVRKHLSRVKGGRLAAATQARVLNLVISDVLGDDLSVIASGVASPDTTSFSDALALLDKYGLDAPRVRGHLLRGARGEVDDNPTPKSPVWRRVETKVVGSNRLLLQTAKEYWEDRGYQTVILSDRFDGEARDVARFHAEAVLAVRTARLGGLRAAPLATSAAGKEALAALAALRHDGGPLVLLSGGEATVTVSGSGRGGRNQEFALWLLKYLGEGRAGVPPAEGVWAISAGSDGIDGNSPAAGAVLTPDSRRRAADLGLDIADYLARNDSFGFFERLGASVVTGHTGNNLNDYRALVIDRG